MRVAKISERLCIQEGLQRDQTWARKTPSWNRTWAQTCPYWCTLWLWMCDASKRIEIRWTNAASKSWSSGGKLWYLVAHEWFLIQLMKSNTRSWQEDLKWKGKHLSDYRQRHENLGKTNAIHRIQPILEISSRYAQISETAGFARIHT
jgi:hypothetical protein